MPGLVYFHGGGWVARQPRHARRAVPGAGQRAAAASSSRSTTAWRPSTRFPAAIDDCCRGHALGCRATPHELGIDPRQLAVGGDSAGGNLAAAVALVARDAAARALRPPAAHLPGDRLQLRDARRTLRQRRGLHAHARGDALLLAALPARRGGRPTIRAPRRCARPDFSSLPPALVITAEFDPLRDEGRAYADKLRAAGVPVTYSRVRRAWCTAS